jgi:hypothetical protein
LAFAFEADVPFTNNQAERDKGEAKDQRMLSHPRLCSIAGGHLHLSQAKNECLCLIAQAVLLYPGQFGTGVVTPKERNALPARTFLRRKNPLFFKQFKSKEKKQGGQGGKPFWPCFFYSKISK